MRTGLCARAARGGVALPVAPGQPRCRQGAADQAPDPALLQLCCAAAALPGHSTYRPCPDRSHAGPLLFLHEARYNGRDLGQCCVRHAGEPCNALPALSCHSTHALTRCLTSMRLLAGARTCLGGDTCPGRLRGSLGRGCRRSAAPGPAAGAVCRGAAHHCAGRHSYGLLSSQAQLCRQPQQPCTCSHR